MKKKGFTLIELLAVIVVLAIIALIATPIVMNTIKNSKKGAAERTADNYTDQVETSLMTYLLKNGENLPDGTYSIDSNGNLVGDEATLTIEMSGTKPSGGKVVIENSGVDKEDSFMFVGGYSAAYSTNKNTFEAKELEVICTKADGVNLTSLQYGDEFACELGDNDSKTFYVLETNGNNISLIMDRNIDDKGKGTTSGNTVAWISNEDWVSAGGIVTDEMKNDSGACQYVGYCSTNEYGPVTALEYLSSSTASWTKLNPTQISLPSKEQISQSYSGSMPTWLYEKLNSSSAPYGYWTSTPGASDSPSAWSVRYDGALHGYFVGYDDGHGVRPVITISKSQLG